MTDKQQIEEIASIICKETSNKGLCEKCGFKKHEQFGYTYQCHKFDTAEALYKADYRKIPKGAVVLTKEEYDNMFSFKTTRGGFYNILDTVREVQSQETAKEILKWLVDTGVINTAPDTIKMYFKEHFSVEAKQ